MIKDWALKIMGVVTALLGALFLMQRSKTNRAEAKAESAIREKETLKQEMRVEKAVEEGKTAIIDSKTTQSANKKAKEIQEVVAKVEKKQKKKIEEVQEDEEFTFSS